MFSASLALAKASLVCALLSSSCSPSCCLILIIAFLSLRLSVLRFDESVVAKFLSSVLVSSLFSSSLVFSLSSFNSRSTRANLAFNVLNSSSSSSFVCLKVVSSVLTFASSSFATCTKAVNLSSAADRPLIAASRSIVSSLLL